MVIEVYNLNEEDRAAIDRILDDIVDDILKWSQSACGNFGPECKWHQKPLN